VRVRVPAARRWGAAPGAVLLALVTAGCSGQSQPDVPSPFADCSAITGPSATTGPTDLPDLRLPCFTGGKKVALTEIRGPAVINFWASWCGPCRAELPVIQALAARSAGKLTVLGVDTNDSRDAGASFAAAKQVTMPTLFDQDKSLFNALAGRALPMTVFVDAAGHRFVYVYPLTVQTLPQQVHTHTGVTVTL
jgi:cytochrome c biogenesis protein CcmG/thiol:disulfide interchange protein DsbE